ncbi:hypothetical protein [Actinobacillus pleuropneumoniae]|nr:hypothetical protein [Actinobacillus pleuropneumoniae]
MNADFVQNRHAHCGCQSCTGQNCRPDCQCQNGKPCICDDCTCNGCACES